MQFVRVNDATLHYQVLNASPDRPRLVFVNSLGTDFRIWRDVVVRLAGAFSILCYDKRGHGLSDIGATPYTIGTHAGDLAALMAHAGFGPSIICGISVGGLIAQQLYASRPDLVSGLVLCDTAHRIGTDETWNARLAAIDRGGLEGIADSVMQAWFTADFRADTAALAGYRNMLTRTPLAGYTATVGAIRDADLTDAAPLIGVPTVCLVGEHDVPTPPALVAELARLIPGGRYELIRGAGHLPCIERPEITSEIIESLSAMVGADNEQQRH